MWGPGVLGSAFLGMFIAFLWALPGQIRDNGYTAIVPLLILGPLGIGLTLRTLHLVIRWIKYGGSRLRLETVPIPLGGSCRAELTLSKRIKAGQAVKFRLQCVGATTHEMRSMSDGSTSQETNYQVMWEDEETVVSDGSGKLPIAFAVPADVQGTGACYSWYLKAEAPGGGTGSYHAELQVPVFTVAPTEAQVRDAKSIASARENELEVYQPGPMLQVRISPAPEGGTEFIFPPCGPRSMP